MQNPFDKFDAVESGQTPVDLTQVKTEEKVNPFDQFGGGTNLPKEATPYVTSEGSGSAFLMKTHPTLIHLASSGAVWIVYALILILHFLKRPSPKALSQWTILAFIFALITLSALG